MRGNRWVRYEIETYEGKLAEVVMMVGEVFFVKDRSLGGVVTLGLVSVDLCRLTVGFTIVLKMLVGIGAVRKCICKA